MNADPNEDEHEDEGGYGDALTLFREAQEVQQQEGSERVFASGEHVWLGQAGAASACIARKHSVVPFTRVRRARTSHTFSYGELVALSGDFYGSPEALFDEAPAKLPWLWQANNVDKLRKLFAKELDAIEQQRRGESVGYPEANVAYAIAAKNYVELAVDNNAHFGWHNIKAYVEHHERALALALESRDQCERGEPEADLTWRRAICMNAFADHFLTDAFAAGHVRVPRAQVRTLGTARGWSDALAGALSKLLHDQDGHLESIHTENEFDRPAEDGLHVTNALGVDWFTRCDGQLFIAKDDDDDPVVAQPVSAVKESVAELLDARHQGVVPEGTYGATMHVPFPHPDVEPLAVKFSPSRPAEHIDRLHKSMSWLFKLPWGIGSSVRREHVVELFELLPELMQQFRADVAKDVAADPRLTRRLPPAYVAAFGSIA